MYRWGIEGKGDVAISDNVELPQFKIKGVKKDAKVESLVTGELLIMVMVPVGAYRLYSLIN